jgi:hypothetical protein
MFVTRHTAMTDQGRKGVSAAWCALFSGYPQARATSETVALLDSLNAIAKPEEGTTGGE